MTDFSIYRKNDYQAVFSAYKEFTSTVSAGGESILKLRSQILTAIELKQFNEAQDAIIKSVIAIYKFGGLFGYDSAKGSFFIKPDSGITRDAIVTAKMFDKYNYEERMAAYYILKYITNETGDIKPGNYANLILSTIPADEPVRKYQDIVDKKKALISEALSLLNNENPDNNDDILFMDKILEARQADPTDIVDVPGYDNASLIKLIKKLYDFYTKTTSDILDKSAPTADEYRTAWDALNQAQAILNYASGHNEMVLSTGEKIQLNIFPTNESSLLNAKRTALLEKTVRQFPYTLETTKPEVAYSNIVGTLYDLYIFFQSNILKPSGVGAIAYTYPSERLESFKQIHKKITDTVNNFANAIGFNNYISGKKPTDAATIEAYLKVIANNDLSGEYSAYKLVFDLAVSEKITFTPTGTTKTPVRIGTQSIREWLSAQYKKLIGSEPAATLSLLEMYKRILEVEKGLMVYQERKAALVEQIRDANSIKAINDLLQDPANKDLLADAAVQAAAKDEASADLADKATLSDLNKFKEKIADDPEVNSEAADRSALIDKVRSVLTNTDPATAQIKTSPAPSNTQLDEAALAAKELLKTPDAGLAQRYLVLLKIRFYTLLAQYSALGEKRNSAYDNTNPPKISDTASGVTFQARNEKNIADGRDIAITTAEYDYYPTRSAQKAELTKLFGLINAIESFTVTIPALESTPSEIVDIVNTYWDSDKKTTKAIATLSDAALLSSLRKKIEENTEYITYNREAILAIYEALLLRSGTLGNKEKAFGPGDTLRKETDQLTTLTRVTEEAKRAAIDLVRANDPESIAKLQAELDKLMSDYVALTRAWNDIPAITETATADSGTNGLETRGGIKEHLYYVKRKDLYDRIIDLRTILTPANLARRPEPAAILDQADQTNAIQVLLTTYFNTATNTVNTSAINALTTTDQVQAILNSLDKGLEFVGYAGITATIKINPDEALRQARAIYTALLERKTNIVRENETVLSRILNPDNKLNEALLTKENLDQAEAARKALPVDNPKRIAYEKALLEYYVTQISKYSGFLKLTYENNAVPLNATQDGVDESRDEKKDANYRAYTIQTGTTPWTFVQSTADTTIPVKEATQYAQQLTLIFNNLQILSPKAEAILKERALALPTAAPRTLPAEISAATTKLKALKTATITIDSAPDIILTFETNAEYLSAIAEASERKAITQAYARALSFQGFTDAQRRAIDDLNRQYQEKVTALKKETKNDRVATRNLDEAKRRLEQAINDAVTESGFPKDVVAQLQAAYNADLQAERDRAIKEGTADGSFVNSGF